MNDYERQLLKIAQKGGVKAFEELTAHHQVLVYNFMLNENSNEFTASQLTQEVFVRIFEMLTTNAAPEDFYACIYRTAGEVSRQAACKSKMIS